VVHGVYAILNDRTLQKDRGRLGGKRLPEILPEAAGYPTDMQRFILDLMRKFELCFDYPGIPDTVLIPELLPEDEPDLGWDEPKDYLNFEYRYPIFPPGLIPRLIVRMHKSLTEKPTYWRSGVVLAIVGCKVLVRGDRRRSIVRIAVKGPREARREALAEVRIHFAAIHATIPKLEVTEQVPLPDFPEVAVPYADLVDLEQQARTDPGADQFMPEDLPPGRKRWIYSARALLDGVDEGPAEGAPRPPPDPDPSDLR
jgi:internalin A